MRSEPFELTQSAFAGLRRTLVAMFFLFSIVPLGNSNPAKTSAATSETGVFDTASFATELRRLSADIESSKNSPDKLRQIRESLPEAWEVGSGEKRIGVPTGLLESKLLLAESNSATRQKSVDQAREYLAALATEAESGSGGTTQDTESARDKLQAILARSEFGRSHEPSWWDRLRMRINELILEALERILGRVGGARSFGYALLWIGICAAALLIAYWIFGRWFQAARMEEMSLHAAANSSRSWQEWVFSAREAAARGDYRMAVHCAYWAGIIRLQDLGALSADRSKTPREYLRALSQSGGALNPDLDSRRAALGNLTSLLEKIWYGFQIASDADFRNSLTNLETLGCHLP